MEISVQLYTIREETQKDFIGSLKKVSEIGYAGVEFAGFGGISSQEMKKTLDELGLKASSSHVGFGDLENDLEKVIAYHKEIGCKYIVCPGTDVSTSEAIEKAAAVFERAAKECASNNIVFGYHNHDGELKNKIDGKMTLELLFEATPNTAAELDTYWVKAGGEEPVEYMKKYKGRLPLIHLKDMDIREDGSIDDVVLGTGKLDQKLIVEAARELGVEWLVVEQDNCNGPCFEDIAASLKYLKSIL